MLYDLADHLGHVLLRAGGFRTRRMWTSVGEVFAYEHRGGGDLPGIVLVHGISAAATHFAPVAVALRRHARRVVLIELPGHGRSAVPVDGLRRETLTAGVREALDKLIDEPVLLFGNSLGGLAAIRYAAARPEKVAALMLVSPGGAPLPTDDDLARFLERFDMPTRREATRFVGRLYARPPWYARFAAGGVRRAFNKPAMRDFVERIRVEDLLSAEEVAGLQMPGRVIWGRQERLFPPEHREFFRAHLPEHIELVEPDGYGHCPHFDAVDTLASDIRRFAREVLE